MDPKEIFELIVKADEKLKYSNEANMDLRKQQAVELLAQARDAPARSATTRSSSRPRRGWATSGLRR